MDPWHLEMDRRLEQDVTWTKNGAFHRHFREMENKYSSNQDIQLPFEGKPFTTDDR